MLSISDLKKDVLIELDGVPYRIVDSHHTFLGRGGATVRTKLKNLITGSVLERTFRPAEKVTPARIERRKMQYLYRENDEAVFMDPVSFEQETVGGEVIGDQLKFLAEGAEINLQLFNFKVIGLDLPNAVVLKVTDTEPGVRGDTATSSLKPSTVETGAVVNVPLFINIGDRVKIDTRSGAYLERAK